MLVLSLTYGVCCFHCLFLLPVFFLQVKWLLRSEVIAILASGTTYNRWFTTYVVGGIFFGLVLWFAIRYGIPKANEVRGDFQTAISRFR
jgi:lipopolysaccharide export system permease protein